MKKTLTILFLLIAGYLHSQTEHVVRLDSSLSRQGTVYFLVIGNKVDGNKTGVWELYQYSAWDTTKFLAASETYENNLLTVMVEYRLDGYTEQRFDKKGWVIEESNYRYGNLTWQKEYKNRKRAISRTYYPNGQISGEGPEVLVKVIAGCDVGLMNFQREGEWIYYDTNGEEIDRQTYTINKDAFKKV